MSLSLSDPIKLPSGLVLPNRLVKAALAEGLAVPNHRPNTKFERVYSQWGAGGWGAILTGNVMIDPAYCGSAGDLYIEADPHERDVDGWRRYAKAAKSHGTPAIVQINHPGKQSPVIANSKRRFMDKTVSPSPIALNIGDSYLAWGARALLFGTPKEMTLEDIKDSIQKFAEAARFMHEVGFDGVELHGSHGYLIAQFLSEKSNQRTDAYGGTPKNRARYVVEILAAIHKVVPNTFSVGIKLNSADLQHESSLKATLEQISYIVDAGIDYLEISGGTYEDPQMMQATVKSARTSAREAFFLDFAKAVRARFPDLILMLTGGFRTRSGMEAALAENACDLIGLGRAAIINTSLPKELLLNEKVAEPDAQMSLAYAKLPFPFSWLPIKVLGAGAETEHYTRQIGSIAKGLRARPPAGSVIEAQP